jgi:hypothetical protein
MSQGFPTSSMGGSIRSTENLLQTDTVSIHTILQVKNKVLEFHSQLL